jgi:arylsulfatase A-like enzyme
MKATLLLLVSLSLMGRTTCVAEDQPASTNFIFIFVDDLGFADFSCTGNKKVKTPHIDRLATEGTLFKQFYVASPICSPSRVGVTTGQYPARHLINSYLNNRKRNRERGMRDFLDPKVPCIARTFQEAGYATAHYGKWHMGGGRDVGDAPLPSAYGFDDSFVSVEGLGPRVIFSRAGLRSQSAKLGHGPIQFAPKHKLTAMYVDRGIAFLKKNREKPIYLHLWLNDVHDAHNPAPGEAEKYEAVTGNPMERKFFAVLVEMDRQIGRLMEAVEKEGKAGNTLFVLTGDNGPTAWKRQYYDKGIDPPGDTGGYRGRKWSLYEGGIRQPLIVRWPGRVPAGRVDEETILAAVDFFPTFTSIAGVETPEVAFDGIDAKEAFLGNALEREKAIFWEYGRDRSYLRPGLEKDRSPNLALRDGRWKCLLNADGTDLALYDFSNVQDEEKNVASEHPEVAAKMAKKLLEWRRNLPVLGKE